MNCDICGHKYRIKEKYVMIWDNTVCMECYALTYNPGHRVYELYGEKTVRKG